MNNKQRQQIKKWVDSLNKIKEDVESMQEEEQDKIDNMPEGLQDSERGVAMQNAIDNLECASDSIGDAIDNLNDAME